MKHRFTILALVALSGLSLVWAFVASLVAPALPVQATYLPGERRAPLLQSASPITRYVALSGTDSAACAAPESACRTVQYAVDVANEGDTIKVASGVYTEINHHGDLTQVVYLSKTVVLQGGYTTTNWMNADPEANPTTVDARGGGRGMVIWGPISPTVEGFRITGGNAAAGGGNSYVSNFGGGLYLYAAAPVIRDNHVLGNAAPFGGGISLYYSGGVVENNHILSNTATASGGGVLLDECSTLLHSNTISDNVAETGGAGVLIANSSLTLSSNIIAANVVTDGGGGGFYLYESPAVIEGNVIVSNTALDGGGFDLYLSDAIFKNNVIAANEGFIGGGYIVASNPQFLHTTIAHHDAIGFMIYTSTVVMTDTIFSENGTGLWIRNAHTTTLEGTLWNNTDQDWWIEGDSTLITGTHNYWGDPDFVDPDAWDYHIGLNSAALNRGVDAGVYSDFEGDMRPMRGGYDLGADELGPAFVVTKHASPAAEIGERLTYTIRLTNTGVVSFTPVITDFLPGSVMPGGVLTWTAELIPGDVWVQTVPVTIAASHTGPLANVVRVTTEEGPQRVYTHTLVPELVVTKRAEVNSVGMGERLTYTLSVTNTGDFVLHARITDTLPLHVMPAGPLTWTAELALGEVWAQQVVVTPEIGYAGSLTNEVEVTTVEGAVGTSMATVEVIGTPALALAKWASADEVKAGEVVTYTIAVTNTGNVDLHARITDTLPVHVTPAGPLTWMAELAPGEVWTQQVMVRVDEDYTGTLENLAAVSTDEGPLDEAHALVYVRRSAKIYLPLILRQ